MGMGDRQAETEAGAGAANRRPLRSRGTAWARLATRLLLRTGLSADQVSLLGILFSIGGAAAYLGAPDRPWLLLLAALAIQLRLLCNMLDGLVAIEGGRKGPYGPLYNEAPDRLEDSLFLIAAGWAAGLLWLGLLAALLACFTAYVRALGGALGLPQDFSGPMAKPQRMAAMTIGSVAAFAEAMLDGPGIALEAALWIVVAGAALTGARRIRRIAAGLKAAP